MEPQRLFAFGSGAYAGGALATLVVLAGRPLDPPVLAVALLVGVAGAAVTTVAVGRTASADGIEQLQDRPSWMLALAAVPLGLLVPTLLALGDEIAVLGGLPVFWLGIAGVGVAAIGFVTLLHAAERAHVDRLVAESSIRLPLPDPYTSSVRDHRGLLTGLVVVSIAGVVVLSIVDGFDLSLLFTVVPGSVSILLMWSRREVLLLDDGLKRGYNVEPWDRFEGYEVCEDTLVLQRGEWWAGRYEISLTEIEHEDAVRAALEERLG